MGKNAELQQLIEAASKGDRTLVKSLLQQGVDVNAAFKDGFTPLMAASTSGHTDIVNYLVSAGAKTDLRDNRGMTALMMAASMDRPKTVKALIARGADVSARNESGSIPFGGYTPLMHAARNKNADADYVEVGAVVTEL